MTYRIVEVRLRNFKSHQDSRVRLPTGAVALLGENGAGKSSILEAIRLALAVDKRRTRGLSQLVNDRHKGTFTVALKLEAVDGGDPPVEALVEAGQGRARYLVKVGGKLVASGVEAYRREMNKVLGLQYISDPSSFIERAVIVRQGGLQAIAEKMERGRELREEIEAAIGIPEYREALNRLDKARLRVGDQEASISEWQLKRISKRLQEYKDEARKAVEKKDRLEKEMQKLEEEAKRLQEELEELTREKARLEARAQEARRLEEELKKARMRLTSLQDKRARLERQLREAEKARREIPRLQAIVELDTLLAEAHRLKEEAAATRVKISELRNLVDALKTLEEARRAYEENQKLEEEKDRLEGEIRAEEAKLARIRAQLGEARKRLERSRQRIKAILAQASRLAGNRLDGPEDLAREAERLRELESSLEEMLKDLQDRRAGLKARLEELGRIRAVLEKGTGSRCPVCGRELTEDHARRLWEKVNRQIAEATRELERLKREAGELEERLRRARQSRERLERLLDNIHSLREDVPDPGELEDLSERERELEDGLAELRNRLQSIKGRMDALKEDVRRYLWAQGQVKKLGAHLSLEEAEAKLREEESKLDELEKRSGELEGEVLAGTGAGSLEEARRRIGEAREELGRLRLLASRVDEIRREIDSTVEEIQALQDTAAELEERLREAREARERLWELEGEARGVRERLERVQAEVDKARGEAAKLGATLEEARARIGELERLWRLVRAGVAARNILERLQETMYKRSLLVLEEEMGRILESFNLDPARVEIREDSGGPSVRVLTRSGGERSVSMLSGGERTSVALAYVLALNRMMGSRIGFLALDEPTSELDQERRQVLVDLVSRLTGPEGLVRQLIIVTHHEDVMDRVDTVCRVRKVSGVSRVECDA